MGIFNFFKKDKEKLPEPTKPKENVLKSLEEEHGLSTNPLENLNEKGTLPDNAIVKEIKPSEKQNSLDQISLPSIQQQSQSLDVNIQGNAELSFTNVEQEKVEEPIEGESTVPEKNKENLDEEFEQELKKYKDMLKIEKEEHINSFLEVEEQPKEKKVKGTLFVKFEVYELIRENSNKLFESTKSLAKELESFELPLQQQKNKINLLSKELMDFEDQLLSIDSQLFNKG